LFKISEESLHNINEAKTETQRGSKSSPRHSDQINPKKTDRKGKRQPIEYDSNKSSNPENVLSNTNVQRVKNKNFGSLRRAQSDFTFSFFEKLVRTTKLNLSSSSAGSINDNELTSMPNQLSRPTKDGIIENGKNLKQSNTIATSFSKYKHQSQDLDKKISHLKSSYSSSLLNEADQAERLASWKRIRLVRSKSFENLVPTRANVFGRANVSSNESISYSTKLKHLDLKQFKNTLECVRFLASGSAQTKRSKLKQRKCGENQEKGTSENIHLRVLRKTLNNLREFN
jgi:hypothetical protein